MIPERPLAPPLVRVALDEPLLAPAATWEANDGRVLHGARLADERYLWSPGYATFRLGPTGAVTFDASCPEQEARAFWVRSALPLAVQARGTQVLHASAVAGPAGVLALCGLSTAGKSTLCAALALPPAGAPTEAEQAGAPTPAEHAGAPSFPRQASACRDRPQDSRLHPVSDDALASPRRTSVRRLRPDDATLLRPVSDDALAFRSHGAGATALTLPFELRLRPAAVAHLGLPSLAASGDGGEELPLAAIVLLGGDGEPALDRLRPAEALGALMPHAYCFDLEAGKEDLVRAYAALAQAVPVWRLTFPRTLTRLDEALALLRGLAGA